MRSIATYVVVVWSVCVSVCRSVGREPIEMPLEYGLWGPMNRILDFPVDFSTGRNTFGVIFVCSDMPASIS